MADERAPGSPTRSGGAETHSDPIGWPLVERRRGTGPTPASGDRRSTDRPSGTGRLTDTPLWPFRVAALAGAFGRTVIDRGSFDAPVLAVGVVLVAYTVLVAVRPPRPDTMLDLRTKVAAEAVLVLSAIAVTGAWASPYVLFLIPTVMLAGFSSGVVYSLSISCVAAAVIGLSAGGDIDARSAVRTSLLWVGLLAVVGFASGLAHRTAADAERQQRDAIDRVGRLVEANGLLFSLQRVAQTMPASLDLDEVLDSTVERLRSLVRAEVVVVYLVDETHREARPVRSHGVVDGHGLPLDTLPSGLRAALTAPRTVRHESLDGLTAVATDATSGLYTALRARGEVIGLIAVERRVDPPLGPREAELLHGVSEPFGVAIDNARLFRRIRTRAVDEERARIARELHDQFGSSLALIGFELDRAIAVAADPERVAPLLTELRAQVSEVLLDVRNTLFDLRTDVTESRGLAQTARMFLDHVAQRSSITTEVRMDTVPSLGQAVEHELWQIVREAVINAERHARASRIVVASALEADHLHVSVTDDGVGVDPAAGRTDSFGLAGMHERAQRIAARLTVRSVAEGGTEVRVEMPLGGVA